MTRDRSGQVNLLLTPAQKTALERKAKKRGMSVTAYILMILELHVDDFPMDKKPRGNPNLQIKKNSLTKPLDK